MSMPIILSIRFLLSDMQAIVFIGIQASGKSTFYKQRFFNTHVRISMDLLHNRRREERFLNCCLETLQPFVVDNTNPTAGERKRYIEPARERKYQIIGYYFESRVAPALQRNAQRPERERIPIPGIWGTAGRLEQPRYEEGFDRLYYVRIGDGGDFVVEDWKDE